MLPVIRASRRRFVPPRDGKGRPIRRGPKIGKSQVVYLQQPSRETLGKTRKVRRFFIKAQFAKFSGTNLLRVTRKEG